MPKLWSDTIEAHRHQVKVAIVAATARLVAERGLTAVSMSHVADAAGIGRATLYKYFTDVQAIITTWHAAQIDAHLRQLAALVDERGNVKDQLQSVMLAYAHISGHRAAHQPELSAALHEGPEVAEAHQRLLGLFTDLIGRAASSGLVRTDVAADELAAYCVHALSAASMMVANDAVGRLVDVVLTGLLAGGSEDAEAAKAPQAPTPKSRRATAAHATARSHGPG